MPGPPARTPATRTPATHPATRPALRLVLASLRRSRRAAWSLTLWTLLSAAPALVTGKALALAVDQGFLVQRPRTAALGLGVFAGAALLGAWASRQTYPALAEIVEPARDALLRDVVTGTVRRAVADATRPDTGAAAVAVAQLTRQVEAVRDALAGQLMLVWQFALTLAAVVVGTAAVAPAAVPLFAVPLTLALIAFGCLAPVTVRRQREAFRTEEELAAHTAATVGALRDIIACGARADAEREALELVAAQFRAARALARVAALRRLIVALGVHLPVVLIVAYAPALVRGGLTPGAVVGVLAYLFATLEPALRLLVQGVGASWLRLAVAAERLDLAARHPAPPADPTPGMRPADGSARLAAVTFAYGPGAEPVLDGLDLSLADGEHLVVVGPSGIGKSTLADVLTGLLRPGGGRVDLGGVPLDRIAARDLHHARVLVPQHPYVFAGTLRENLCHLAPAPDAVLADVIGKLGLDPLAERLGGPDGRLEPGALSSGERALVALARAYLSPARLVVLDEATRHLDAAAELAVEEAFRQRPGTVVTIAHRLAPARRADRVLLLDGVRPLAGTHASLLAGSPLYADLVGQWDGRGPDTAGPPGADPGAGTGSGAGTAGGGTGAGQPVSRPGAASGR
ncbi:ABC transporter ATP-binding protein/permease [Streptomyces bambusae]|uniref:ATP-binding cassette domain-containing protein n=1 Tax=Streptomyces bambusae TaxID=1550616 RepID=UPI001CFDF70F|nr:ABC transporter ATP-binding protein [Streptomyces bambusae]MCB5167653.1 ABC transporter ATP-binding protein/permease [Streptomyces bambusae]